MRDINRVFMLIVCLYLIGSTAAGVLFPALIESAAGSVLTAQALILAGTGIGCRMLHVRPAEHMRLRGCRPWAAVYGAACTLALYPWLMLVSGLVRLFFKSGTLTLTTALTEGNFFLNLIIFALIPAVCEELMNRGLLYRAYREKMGICGAAVMSAAAFGLFHMNFDQAVYTFVFGIFLCLMTELSDSIRTAVICHFTLNAVSVTAAYAISAFSSGAVLQTASLQGLTAAMESSELLLYVVLLFVSGVCFAVCFRGFLRCCIGKKQLHSVLFGQQPDERKKPEKIVTIEWILAAGICVLYMAVYEGVL